jgi:hypothetical protein
VGKTILGAVVSLDGFMADDDDGVGPLFDWLGNGDVAWSFPGSDGVSRTTQASADFMLDLYGDMAANVIGRRVFDLTNGWNGKPAAGEHVFVVTHRPPTDWDYYTAPRDLTEPAELLLECCVSSRQQDGRWVGSFWRPRLPVELCVFKRPRVLDGLDVREHRRVRQAVTKGCLDLLCEVVSVLDCPVAWDEDVH